MDYDDLILLRVAKRMGVDPDIIVEFDRADGHFASTALKTFDMNAVELTKYRVDYAHRTSTEHWDHIIY